EEAVLRQNRPYILVIPNARLRGRRDCSAGLWNTERCACRENRDSDTRGDRPTICKSAHHPATHSIYHGRKGSFIFEGSFPAATCLERGTGRSKEFHAVAHDKNLGTIAGCTDVQVCARASTLQMKML